MGRIRQFLILLLCIAMLSVTVYAQTGASEVQSWSTVSSNGTCQVTMTVKLHLESVAKGLTFPLPREAKNVTINGTSARTYSSATDNNVVLTDLSHLDGMMGDVTVSFQYTLSTVLKTVEKKLYMELPLLCGFDYPIQSMIFSINMPGEISGNPSFTSSHLQTGADSVIHCTTGGRQIDGFTTAALKDRATLSMTMLVSEDMFPGQLIIPREGNPEVIPMSICAALALIYWLLMMRCAPVFRQRRTTALDGVTAGELGSHLTAAGADLTMMAFSWAQLGYLRVTPDKYGRVFLQKRMEMGNERTDFEIRCFKALFSRGNTVDATSTAYAKLCRKVAQTVPGIQEMYTRRAGNINLFRALACGVSLFCGICFANTVTTNRVTQTLLSILFGIIGVVTAWTIQSGVYRMHIRGKTIQYVGSVCYLVWIILGIICGQWIIALCAVMAQLVAGLAAAYGGRRSELGRYQANQILGLRHYLGHIPREDVERQMENNPDYFFELLPCAIALGVDGSYARCFRGMKLTQCTYFTARENHKRTAEEWAILMRKTADKMDKRQRRMQLERWLPLPLRKY